MKIELDSTLIINTRETIQKRLEQIHQENRITPVANAIQRIDKDHRGRTSDTTVIAAMQNRDPGLMAMLKVHQMDEDITTQELDNLKSLVQGIAAQRSGKDTPFDNLKESTIDKILKELVKTAMTANLESVSQQTYQLNLLNKLLKFVEDHPEKLESWGKNKYKHYIEDDAKKDAKNPAHAINLVCNRVCTDLGATGKLSDKTAREIGALLTAIGGQFKKEVRAELKGDTAFPSRGEPSWEPFRNTPGNWIKNFIFKNAGAPYSKVVDAEGVKTEGENADKIKGSYPTSKFGPSLTVWHTTRFLEVCLKANREEEKVYAATQAADWAANNSWRKGEKYGSVFAGAHSEIEALMTFAHAVGADHQTARPRETLIRLILETNFSVDNGKLVPDRITALNVEQKAKEAEELQNAELIDVASI